MANPQPDQFTKLSNELLEAMCCIQLSGHEWSIVHTVIRKTYGFNKKSDWIALSQLCEATGLIKQRVNEAKQKLLAKGILIQEGKKLSLNKDYDQWGKSNGKTLHGNGKALQKVTEKRAHKRKKETIQKTLAKSKFSQGELATNEEDMWNQKSDDYLEGEVQIDPDFQPDKPVDKETVTPTQVLDYWNQFPTFADLAKIKGVKGKPKNKTTITQLLPNARKTKDTLYAIGIVAKGKTMEDFELGIDNYIRELIHKDPRDSWAGKRYSLYDLMKNKGYNFKTYVNR